LPATGQVLLEVYDITGRKVASLVNGEKKAGTHSCQFVSGDNLHGGMYFARLTFNNIILTKRMVCK
jgi:hypothetical protein